MIEARRFRVTLGLAVALLLVGCDGSAPVPSATTSTGPQVSPAPVTPSTSGLDGYAWHRLEPIGQGWLNDVTAWKGGLAAVGSDIWLSPDGRRWGRVEHHAIGGDWGTYDIVTVAAWGDGLIAAGRTRRAVGPDAVWITDAAFWVSPNGVDWTVATGPPFQLGAESIHSLPYGIRDVVSWDGGLVAIGIGDVATVWTSDDGRDWRMATVLADGGGRQIVSGGGNGLAATAAGLVAVGEEGCCGETRALAWTSPDGATWRSTPELVGQGLHAIAAGPHGLVAVGQGPGVWTSDDGRTWTWAPDQAALDEGWMDAVIADDLGIAAVGRSGCAVRDEACPAFWTSADGVAWELTRDPTGLAGEAAGVARLGSDLVAVGTDHAGHQENSAALAWIGRPGEWTDGR